MSIETWPIVKMPYNTYSNFLKYSLSKSMEQSQSGRQSCPDAISACQSEKKGVYEEIMLNHQ